MSVIHFWLDHRAETATLLAQHVVLVVVSTALAAAVGIPAGVLAARRPRAGGLILIIANAAQTIPSLALLGFLLSMPLVGGIGPRTALIALFLYALLPILRATVTGIRNVDASAVEAGVAMGMTNSQLLRLVELPLALPTIIAGLRVATVIGIGTATIAAAIGAGGLGDFIFRGLSMVDTTVILAGAVPAAGLALAADGLLAWIESGIRRRRRRSALPALAAAMVLTAVAIAVGGSFNSHDRVVVIGSKNFTEQVILGEMLAQAIEAEGGVRVQRQLNLGGTFVCDRAIRAGDLDGYVEYTGTAVTAVFHEDVPHQSRRAFERARELYARGGLTALEPLGFNNTFAILVRAQDANRLALHTIEDLQGRDNWTAGFGYEFLQRDDGYPGLMRAYGLRFRSPPRAMDLSLIYRALAEQQVDVIAGDATSAQIDALHLVALDDNRRYFPPYDAIPVIRTATLLRYPEVGRALARLAGQVSDRDMRTMNASVDIRHEDVGAVVRAFLARTAH